MFSRFRRNLRRHNRRYKKEMKANRSKSKAKCLSEKLSEKKKDSWGYQRERRKYNKMKQSQKPSEKQQEGKIEIDGVVYSRNYIEKFGTRQEKALLKQQGKHLEKPSKNIRSYKEMKEDFELLKQNNFPLAQELLSEEVTILTGRN